MSTPSRLGRYPVRRRLGAGAFATVWLAYDEHLDSEVAIKVLADNWTEDLHVRRRFVEEGRFLRKVQSPHVVSVYDAGELPDGRPFLVMSYADQGTLADRLERGRLSPAQALHVIDQAGQGLAALHDRGVLHRDVKPANVLLRSIEPGSSEPGSSELCAMLGDLGLGKAMDMSSRLTMIGGTPTFVSPEQARGEGLDGRADQYSLAALTYLLLTGRPPFDHQSLTAAADPEPPTPLGGDLPAAADDVIRKALSRERDQRYDDVPAYVAALTAALGSGVGSMSGPAATSSTPYSGADATERLEPARAAAAATARRRPRAAWLAAAVLAVVVGVGAGWAVEQAISSQRVLVDATGSITVTVPEEWTSSVRADPWTPPRSESRLPSLSAGSTSAWNTRGGAAPGVFVGVVESGELPRVLPRHECESRSSQVSDVLAEGASLTQISTGCRGTEVTVERLIQVNGSQLAWVQIRSDDQPTAKRVLDSIELHGL